MNIFEDFKNLGFLPSGWEEYEHPIAENEQRDILEEEKPHRNFWGFYLILAILILVLMSQLLNLQVSKASRHQLLAQGNRIRTRIITAPRGTIVDQKGKILAKNIPSFSLELYPFDLPRNATDRQKIYEELTQITQIPIEQIARVEKNGLLGLDPVVLKENIDRDQALLWQTKIIHLPGVVMAKQPIRQYQSDWSLGHILGYVGKINQEEFLKNQNQYRLASIIGKAGLENFYEQDLYGQEGQEQIEVDSQGRLQRVLNTTPPAPGKSLVLTIDSGLQQEIFNDLSTQIQESKVKKGVAIAINPSQGAILGMVSIPSYDDNLFINAGQDKSYEKYFRDEERPLINRAISGLYPSGSTIKPTLAAAALQEGTIDAKTTISDPGLIQVGSWTFPDWTTHGTVDVKKAIAVSCNVFFYSIGGGWDKIKGLGIEKIKQYWEKFGFGAKTGVDLPGEIEGLIPDPQWKKKVKGESWYIGDTYHLSIGQGDFLTTPLQLLMANSAIANGGELIKPYLVDKIISPRGEEIKKTSKTIIRKDFISPEKMEIVRQGMRQTVESGSARALNDLPFTNAGKTGTAQSSKKDITHAWYFGFAPYENPQIAVIVLVEDGGEGFSSAAPVAKKIFDYYFRNK
jgi:penicillin-binding protein 2